MTGAAKPTGLSRDRAVIDEVATFVRVVRTGSFAAAARELRVPKSTVSRRLTRLEAALGVKLLHRGPRKFTLSAEGTRLFDNVHTSIEKVELALHGAQQGGLLPRGHIRITAPEDFGRLLLLDELQAFGLLWPEITFELELSNRYVDLVQEGFDLAIRATPATVLQGTSDLITRKLFSSKRYIAACPQRTNRIESIADLAKQPFVLFRQSSRRQDLELIDAKGRKHRISVEGRFVVHDYGSMASLVAQGAGLGLIPRMHIDHSKGALSCLFPEYSSGRSQVALVYPSRQLPRRVSLLLDHLSQRLGEVEG